MPSDLLISDFGTDLAIARGFVCIEGDTLAVPLRRGGRRGKSRANGWFLISREDRHLTDYYWSLDPCGYPRRRDKTGGGIRISREVMGLVHGDGLVVDHINRDKLDNRRENLRVVRQWQNCQNQSARKGSSRFRGVSLQGDKWMAHGSLRGKMTCIGYYDDEQEAADAAREWRREYMPYSID